MKLASGMGDREMTTNQVGNAIIRASKVKPNDSFYAEKAAKAGEEYTNSSFPPYVKAAARQLGAHTRGDF